MRNMRLSTFDACHYLRDLGNGLGKIESMKLFITLFYSILFRLCLKRNDLLPYDLPPSSRTNILGISGSAIGKADKTNNNERSSQNNTSNQ